MFNLQYISGVDSKPVYITGVMRIQPKGISLSKQNEHRWKIKKEKNKTELTAKGQSAAPTSNTPLLYASLALPHFDLPRLFPLGNFSS